MIRSDSSWEQLFQIITYLMERDDFLASKLRLVGQDMPADVVVNLKTRPTVVGLDTHSVAPTLFAQNANSGASTSQYLVSLKDPGITAMLVMRAVGTVCPSIPRRDDRVPELIRETSCVMPPPGITTLSVISSCVKTSWMDDSEIQSELSSRSELQQMGVSVAPSCSEADATLVIRHDLDHTTEWPWSIESPSGEKLASGRVIAFTSKTAARQIAMVVVGELEAARGIRFDSTLQQVQLARNLSNIEPRTISVRLVPSDFSVKNTRALLEVDSEDIRLISENGEPVLSFPLEELRDIRVEKTWDQPYLLPPPDSLVQGLMQASSQEEFYGYVMNLAIYTGAAATLAQFRSPSRIVDLTWEQEGAIKTTTVMVSRRNAHYLEKSLRNLRRVYRPSFCSVIPSSSQ